MATDVWHDDLLGRQHLAEIIVKYLVRRTQERLRLEKHGSYVLNLNSGWGHGKTFFLERLNKQLAQDGYLSVYVNGWRDDAGQEPLVAVIAAIEEGLKEHFRARVAIRKLWDKAKIAGGQALLSIAKGALHKASEKFIGEGMRDAIEIIDRADTDAARKPGTVDDTARRASDSITKLASNFMTVKLDEYKRSLDSTESFKSNVSALLHQIEEHGQSKLPLFVLIDELDRCRPTYAIEMLEQVKHLFDIDSTVFIVATDSDQLSHSIRAVYGEQFDSVRYLNRFFNSQFQFPEPSINEFIEVSFNSHGILIEKLSCPGGDIIQFCADGALHYGLKLRDVDQCMDILHSIVTNWTERIPIELIYMFPLIVAYQQSEHAMFSALSRLDVASPLRGAIGQWNVPLPYVDRQEHRRVVQATPVQEIMKRHMDLAKESLIDIVRTTSGSGDAVTEWSSGRFKEELNANVPGRQTERRSHSILDEYPSRVAELGRFTLIDEPSTP